MAIREPAPETRLLGTGGPPIPRLGFGGCPLGGHDWGAVDERLARAAVARAAELGVRLFDTADCYGLGHSERVLAAELGSRRHDLMISTKGGVRWDESGRTWRDTSPGYLGQALRASLRRLGLESIPLYFIHWPDATTPIEESVSALVRLRDAGLIGHIGVSNFDVEQLQRAASVAPIAAIQVRGSLLRRSAMEAVADEAHRSGAAVMTWGSLGEGLLSAKYDRDATFTADDRRSRYEDFRGEHLHRGLAAAATVREIAGRVGATPAQVALRWLLDSPAVDFVLFGAKTPAQVEDNWGALGWSLTPDDHHLLSRCATHD